jgi:hypothetical protein
VVEFLDDVGQYLVFGLLLGGGGCFEGPLVVTNYIVVLVGGVAGVQFRAVEECRGRTHRPSIE